MPRAVTDNIYTKSLDMKVEMLNKFLNYSGNHSHEEVAKKEVQLYSLTDKQKFILKFWLTKAKLRYANVRWSKHS